MRTLSSSLTLVGHLGCDRRGDQSGGEKELHFGAMVAENTRRCATAPPDTFPQLSWKTLVPLPMRAMRRSVFPKCRRMHPRCSIMLQMGQEAVPQHGDENFRPFPLLSRSSPPMTASAVEDENEGRFGQNCGRFNPRCIIVAFGAQNACSAFHST